MNGFIKLKHLYVANHAVKTLKAHPGSGHVTMHFVANRTDVSFLNCEPGQEDTTAQDIIRRILSNSGLLDLTSMLDSDDDD